MATTTPSTPNRFATRCADCSNMVAVKAGTSFKVDGKWLTLHAGCGARCVVCEKSKTGKPLHFKSPFCAACDADWLDSVEHADIDAFGGSKAFVHNLQRKIFAERRQAEVVAAREADVAANETGWDADEDGNIVSAL